MNYLFNKRGFTAFFAILVSSLALAVGLAIYDLVIREIALTQTATQSQYAIFAADTGAECALYWDSKAPILNGYPSVFGSALGETWGSSPIPCATQDITLQGPPAVDLAQYPGCVSNQWCKISSGYAATTTFSLIFPQTLQTYCVTVEVAKWRDVTQPTQPPQTKVIAHGYNNCIANGPVRVERALQVNY